MLLLTCREFKWCPKPLNRQIMISSRKRHRSPHHATFRSHSSVYQTRGPLWNNNLISSWDVSAMVAQRASRDSRCIIKLSALDAIIQPSLLKEPLSVANGPTWLHKMKSEDAATPYGHRMCRMRCLRPPTINKPHGRHGARSAASIDCP